MGDIIADPSTTARWSAAMKIDKIVPQWSLRRSCLCTVKDNLFSWSRSGRNSVRHNSSAENPFFRYPIDIKQDLLYHLLQLKPTGQELLQAVELLLSSGIPSFDLSCLDGCMVTDVQTIVRILIRTGNCLQQLILAGKWFYHESSAPLVRSMLRSFPNLSYLKLQRTSRDGLLELVLKYCPKLTRLEVIYPSLNEVDIDSLCKVMQCDPDYKHAKKQIKEIKLPCSVNGKGVLKLLEAFPCLEYIMCTCLDLIMYELLENCNTLYWRERCSKLRGLHNHLLAYEGVALELVVAWFPNLEEISLVVHEHMEIQPLAKLKRLRFLQLRNSSYSWFSYDEKRILPLLSCCGKNLTSLSFERFATIDLEKIATYCPNLRSFSAKMFSILNTSGERGSKKQFLNLRYLRLRPEIYSDPELMEDTPLPTVTAEACESLLSNSQCLEHLEFYCSYGLTDTLVNKLLETNKFTQLRSLLLREGSGLSSNGILQLTKTAQNLRIWDVDMISSD